MLVAHIWTAPVVGVALLNVDGAETALVVGPCTVAGAVGRGADANTAVEARGGAKAVIRLARSTAIIAAEPARARAHWRPAHDFRTGVCTPAVVRCALQDILLALCAREERPALACVAVHIGIVDAGATAARIGGAGGAGDGFGAQVTHLNSSASVTHGSIQGHRDIVVVLAVTVTPRTACPPQGWIVVVGRTIVPGKHTLHSRVCQSSMCPVGCTTTNLWSGRGQKVAFNTMHDAAHKPTVP